MSDEQTPQHPSPLDLIRPPAQVFVHPQTLLRCPIAALVDKFDGMDRSLSNVRTRSGVSLLMLREKPQAPRGDP